MTLLFNNFALAYQIVHNSVSSNHPDLEEWILTRFLEEVITLMLQSLSQTGIKRKYNVLGKLSHICFTDSFFLLSLKWEHQLWALLERQMLPSHTTAMAMLQAPDTLPSGKGTAAKLAVHYSSVIHASSRFKKGGRTRSYCQLPLYAWNSWACMEDTKAKELLCSPGPG